MVSEKVEKLGIWNAQNFEKEKKSNEALIVFGLRNSTRIAYVVDILTMKDVQRRLKGGIKGILRIGDNEKVDLNQVSEIFINSERVNG